MKKLNFQGELVTVVSSNMGNIIIVTKDSIYSLQPNAELYKIDREFPGEILSAALGVTGGMIIETTEGFFDGNSGSEINLGFSREAVVGYNGEFIWTDDELYSLPNVEKIDFDIPVEKAYAGGGGDVLLYAEGNYYSYSPSLVFGIKQENIQGEPIAYYRNYPSSEVVVATTEGLYYTTTVSNDFIKIDGITPIAMLGAVAPHSSVSLVFAEEGIFLFKYSYPGYEVTDVTESFEGIQGDIVSIASMPSFASGIAEYVIATDNGLYTGSVVTDADLGGETVLPSRIDFDYKTILTPFSEKLISSEGREFIERKYRVPNIPPSNSINLNVSGKVNKISYEANEGQGIVVGNQAWYSSTETPRETPEINTLPQWNENDPLLAGKWTGNPTCTTSSETPGDQCDQVFASIPTTDQLLGSLAGKAWWDKNANGIIDIGEPYLMNVKASLYKGENGEFKNKVGETVTNDNGDYVFENLVPDNDYYVVFNPTQNPEYDDNGNNVGIVGEGESWTYSPAYANPPYYANDANAANNQGITHNLVVAGSESTSLVNMGIYTLSSAIETFKGIPGCEEDECKEVPGTNVSLSSSLEAENDVEVSVEAWMVNTGSEPVDSIVFNDTTSFGKEVAWQACYVGEEEFIIEQMPVRINTQIAPNGSVRCEGILNMEQGDLSHMNIASFTAAGLESSKILNASDDFSASVSPIPTPESAISVEKGIVKESQDGKNVLEILEESEDMITNAKLRPFLDYTVTFRLSNNGDDRLYDILVEDKTILGTTDVENLVCNWQKDSNDRKVLYTRKEAAADSNKKFSIDCTGTLKMEYDENHTNTVNVIAVGGDTGNIVQGNSDFQAETPESISYIFGLPSTGSVLWIIFTISGISLIFLTIYLRNNLERRK